MFSHVPEAPHRMMQSLRMYSMPPRLSRPRDSTAVTPITPNTDATIILIRKN